MNRITFILLLTLFCFTSHSQEMLSIGDQSISSELASFFQYCNKNKIFNGSVLIFKEDKILLQESYGAISDSAENAITSDTPFLLASLSKQFTAAGIMLLKSEGKLGYDEKVEKYLTGFPYPQVTIRHLLNHSSGIQEYTGIFNAQRDRLQEDYDKSGAQVTNERIEAMFAERKPPLAFDPGSNFDYSNTGYVYLALVIESITEMSFPAYLAEAIFKPLGMKNSWGIASDKKMQSNRALGYRMDYMINESSANEMPPYFKVYGDGGIYSSANDLKTWFAGLDDGTIIAEKDLEEAYFKPIFKGEELPYGFGWFVRSLPFNGNKVLTHSGQFVGFTNSVFRDLEDKVTSIILSNNSHEFNGDINSAVVRILYGMSHEKPRLSAEMILGNRLLNSDIQACIDFYDIHKENATYNFSETSINRLGYRFMELGEVNKAIDIFTWNVVLNPSSSNVYDSLGEAYLSAGNKKQALENYQKAFKLDSSNENAKMIIQKLK